MSSPTPQEMALALTKAMFEDALVYVFDYSDKLSELPNPTPEETKLSQSLDLVLFQLGIATGELTMEDLFKNG